MDSALDIRRSAGPSRPDLAAAAPGPADKRLFYQLVHPLAILLWLAAGLTPWTAMEDISWHQLPGLERQITRRV